MRPLPAAGLAATGGLLLTLVAFGDLPLLGALLGAGLSGAMAGLLAWDGRDAALQALAAGAVAVGALLVFLLAGTQPVPGLFVAGAPAAVLALQAGVLAGVTPLVAWAVGRLAHPLPPPPASAEARGGPPPT
jgi:hypothetical protein